ncbi:MAG: glycosyltransferase family 39 protein [Candidatus Poribacteria bacterium]|nr:glycosyltransferase family 39 protein [Candidatus Poribacteria bacterium]
MKPAVLFFTLSLFVATGLPRFFALDSHWSSDETLWLNRSAHFISAVKQREFSETLITHHPGVITMWLAGLRTFFIEPRVDIENLSHARWFISIVVWIGLGIACLLIYQLFGGWVALVSSASLAYSPFFLAQARRVHTDALATTFILLTMLLFFLYCQNRPRQGYLILSGITFGVALMSKSYSLILLPWIPLGLFIFREKCARNFWAGIAEGLCFLNCTALTVLALWPVFWIPIFGFIAFCLLGFTWVLFRGMKKEDCPTEFIVAAAVALGLVSVMTIRTAWRFFEGVHWAIRTPHEVDHFFLGKVVNDPGWLFYPFVLLVKSTPLLLPLALFACVSLWKKRKCSDMADGHFRSALGIGLGIVLFTVCLSGTSKKLSRYLLPVFPMLEILAAISFVEGFKWSSTMLCSRFGMAETAKGKTFLAILAWVGFFSIQIVPVLSCHPYYGTYYNLCWKEANITKIITVGETAGLDLTAKYLNQKHNAHQLKVAVSPLGTRFVQHYFVGFTYNTRKKYLPADYEVVYIRDSQIGKVPQTGTRNGVLEHTIAVNGIDLAWIYRIRDKETP